MQFSEIEDKVRSYWEEKKIPYRLTAIDRKKPKFYLLDGPPYVNAEAHVGHAKTTTYKDIWSKFKLMQGYFSWFQPGFDCHGLPIENMVEKELNLTSKKDIVEKIGVERFIELCREKAHGNEKLWLELYKKLGAWRGYQEPYLTLENYYIESAWWSIKKIAESGLLYEGEKPTYWCPHCQTALSGYEVTDSYKQLTDPYVYVKFPFEGKKNEFIVIFTTTPWTLVSNIAIAVKGDEDYVKVKYKGEILILAEKRVKALEELIGEKLEIVERIKGKELDGLRYLPVLEVPVQQKLHEDQRTHRIYLSIPVLKSKSYKHGVLEKAEKMKEEFFDFVNIEEGSGAVHVATGHGPEDYYLGQHYELPVVSPVDDESRFTDEAGKFKGLFVLDANKAIIEELKKNGFLLYNGNITHAYPVCWRCKTPLIFRMTKQWFISIEPIKEKMLEAIEKVRWLPAFSKERFENWVKDASDWCISRQRYWGIPLPIWKCKNCGHTEVIGSLSELKEKAIKNLPDSIDLHKHIVDKIELRCPNCGGSMKRVPDIIDVWFDSGIAPWASLGYPYRNKELFEWLWPVDIVDESQDQIRGWFYSLMFTAMAVFGEVPYRAVAVNGWVLDEKGEKMSKSLGNVIWAEDALKKFGADVLRFSYCWGNPPWETQNFSPKTVEEIVKVLNIFLNSFNFYQMYKTDVNADPDFKTEDKWIVSKASSVTKEFTASLENFEFNKAGRLLANFITEDLSRFYIKLIRDRVWINAEERSKAAALKTLKRVLLTVTKLLAPISPFISEYVYQELEGGWKGKSVYESSWPTAEEEIDKELEEEVEIAREIIEALFAIRQRNGIRLRWSLKEAKIDTDKHIERVKHIISTLANVEKISIGKEEKWESIETKFGRVYLNTEIDEEILERALFSEIVRKIQELRKKNGFKVAEYITLTLRSDEETENRLTKYLERLSKEVGANAILVGELRGKYKDELEFEGKKIEIAFERSEYA